MKRDWDLLRGILLLTEEQPPGDRVHDFSSLGDDDQRIVEHIRLARDAGLLEARIMEAGRESHAAIIRLTPAGHDFLEHARQPVLWNKAKATVEKAGVGTTIDILKAVLTNLAVAAVMKATTG